VRQSAERQGDHVVGGAWLHLLDVATGKVRLLPFRTKGSYSIRDPAWSADGRTIYWSSRGAPIRRRLPVARCGRWTSPERLARWLAIPPWMSSLHRHHRMAMPSPS
jgi:hypothetical protein